MARFFRFLWGLLFLASCGWVSYGVLVTGNVANQVLSAATATPNGLPTLDPTLAKGATATGVFIGSGLSLAFFLCSGLPALLIFGFLYWRNGVALREAKKAQ